MRKTVIRVTANHAETEQDRLDRSASSAGKRPQRAESHTVVSLAQPKAGQLRDNGRHPGQENDCS